jgi:large subunit ribosomal protein L7/L12
MTRYRTLAQAHKSIPEAQNWVDDALRGIEPDQIVSITQSTAADSGPGYSNFWVTTMIVLSLDDGLAVPNSRGAEAGIEAAAPDEQPDPIVTAADRIYDVRLIGSGPRKIELIKVVMAWRQRGLAEAKELVDRAPAVVFARLPGQDAKAAKEQLEAAGGTVELIDRSY